jgi:hypothetical protein
MKKFKVGDKVQVIYPGNTYETYGDMFVEMGFTNRERNEGFQIGLVVEVFAVGKHKESGVDLVGLQAQDGSQGLMSATGVVVIATVPSSDQQFDIIRQFCDEVLGSQGISDRDIFKYLLQKSCYSGE